MRFLRFKFLKDLAFGLKYLYEQNVIHRNIHTSNVLLAESSDHLTEELADFGIAKISPDRQFCNLGRREAFVFTIRKNYAERKSDVKDALIGKQM